LSPPSSIWNAEEDNVDVSGFITLSHADSARQGLQSHITRGVVIAMVGGTDLRREIDCLSTIRNDDNDDDELLHHAYTMIDVGDDDDDEANEVNDLLNIVNVAMYSGIDEPY
jgi:hypothetical protein